MDFTFDSFLTKSVRDFSKQLREEMSFYTSTAELIDDSNCRSAESAGKSQGKIGNVYISPQVTHHIRTQDE